MSGISSKNVIFFSGKGIEKDEDECRVGSVLSWLCLSPHLSHSLSPPNCLLFPFSFLLFFFFFFDFFFHVCNCLRLFLLLPLLSTCKWRKKNHTLKPFSLFDAHASLSLSLTLSFMEFDLNHEAASVGEKSDDGGGLVKGSSGNSPSSSSSCSSGLSSSSSASASSIYSELWHACAGPLTSLPKKGNVVVYLPQGHLEQGAMVSSSAPLSPMDIPKFDLQPQIFCRVVNIRLLANKETDEVYTQLTLLPQQELAVLNLEGKELLELGGDGERNGSLSTKQTPHMFCKTLTASDTSTHGGFSVPRRAAEDCFPPLDYDKQRPSQELVAKDLHGVEWRFRHIYRGQPRRHLLTTGWSIFVSQKNLVSGDAVLFLRGENGELRLGIRRAARPRHGLPSSVIEQNSFSNILSLVANAVSAKSMFHVFYSPRATHAEFIIPYEKYMACIGNPVSIGTRFRMRYEMDDCPEKRCTGVVTGISDLDPYRWPNSKWRCLLVRWDESFMGDHQERISPWEMDPSVSLPPWTIQPSPRPKRSRIGLLNTPPGNPIMERGAFLDFEELVRPSKVLQGQENIGFASHVHGCDVMNRRKLDITMQSHPNPVFVPSGTMAKFDEFIDATTRAYSSVLDLDRFPRTLQGQEICSFRSLPQTAAFNATASGATILGCNNPFSFQSNRSSFYPLASQGFRSSGIPYHNLYNIGEEPSRRHCHMMSCPRETGAVVNRVQNMGTQKESVLPEKVPTDSGLMTDMTNGQKDDDFNRKVPAGCKLFGFSLPAKTTASNPENSSKRICTKVHKQGSLVGRAIDLSRLNGYDDLITELERLFTMEGLLHDPDKGWRILYTDSENDMMVVGDDPWRDFCRVVAKIHIYTKEEVEKMNLGSINEDNQSCLEEAALMVEASKSSSVSQPDSSPTITRA
ncbi:PREDICTED: auxin response factor 4 isoform X2 [Tarenaya hassleriana]|uniref:auxin response factor 4 isoform X2 n=1 Tax=Tarenaya hassleriana TaxID=28532 RepID=UPI00053C895B|nr:PREDICTED: auxin response factor 4 isoform X2 [Tarenaya hassleriana]